MRCSSTRRTSTPATSGGTTSCAGCRPPTSSSRSSGRTGRRPSTSTSDAPCSTPPPRTWCGSRWRRRCAGTRRSSRCSSTARRCRRVGSCRGPFRPLADVQASTLRHESWERGLAALADDLAERADRFHRDPPAPRAEPERPRANGRTGASRAAWYMAQGSLVTILGSGANAVDRAEPWAHGAASLPDTSELARHLAERFDIEQDSDDLARVSQHVSLTEGRVDLCRTLRELLVNRRRRAQFGAPLPGGRPGRLRELGREAYQLAHDHQLRQRARAGVRRGARALRPRGLRRRPGPHSGRFVHVPGGTPRPPGRRPITVPNEYVDLPIDEDG